MAYYTKKEIADYSIAEGLTVMQCKTDEDKEFYYQHLRNLFIKGKITTEYFDNMVEGYTPLADRK